MNDAGLREAEVSCPYCGEQYWSTVDVSAGSHRTIEDCQVCCRPIECVVCVDSSGTTLVQFRRDDE